jgi:DNA-binding transcriptional regulator WhiA
MALKRVEFKELSFLELGKQFSPPISKSGVYHRLEKIIEFYEELKEKKIL